MDRFTLEDSMSSMHCFGDDIDTILHAYMDAKIRPTEDEMANMLIGVKCLFNARYQKMWQVFEELISNGTLTNKGVPWESDREEQLLTEQVDDGNDTPNA